MKLLFWLVLLFGASAMVGAQKSFIMALDSKCDVVIQPTCDVAAERFNLQKCIDDGETNRVVVYTLYALAGIEFLIILVVIVVFLILICGRHHNGKKRKPGKNAALSKGSKNPKSKEANGSKDKSGTKPETAPNKKGDKNAKK